MWFPKRCTTKLPEVKDRTVQRIIEIESLAIKIKRKNVVVINIRQYL